MAIPNKLYITGTASQVKAAITLTYSDYRMLMGLDIQPSGSSNRQPVSPEFADWLMVTCHWRGVTRSTGKNHTVEKSIRLKGVDYRAQQLPYYKNLAQVVLSKFNNKNFVTGHVKCKYTKWKDGIQTWGYFDSKETGYSIIETLADIAGKSIDRKLFRYEFVLDEAEAFDETPEKFPIAGVMVRPKAKGVIADMKFYAATILFPHIGHVEQLCNISGYVIENLDFLKSYED